ncbi:hypothetical protein NIES592_01085 [Fischerella major NIES-592]|uniref:Uncharacterized protein n=2 Tax=Fischerella TaxID=1190 RepID=A0A1U7H689_9CYAN|nr:hypothetical protein NIES592_01085 [Fischerella major NIES-592]PMB47582.1 hypothetical protein CEN41_03365 [Fischerella thermalis CCMEE 5330]
MDRPLIFTQANHSCVKMQQTSIREDKQQPFLNLRKMIRGWQNIASSTYRKISLAIARLIRDEP